VEVARSVWLAAYVELGTIGAACDHLGIGRSTFYRWKAADPEFAAAVLDAEQDAVDRVEAELYKRARRKSDTALIFYLKTHRPEVYADKRGPSTVVVNQSQTNVGPINTDNWTDDQLSKGQEFFRRFREAIAKMPDTPETGTGG
jgi:hypothetical protein